eukprot:jgi/Botrbrau1/21835/Bobra.0190s0049.1
MPLPLEEAAALWQEASAAGLGTCGSECHLAYLMSLREPLDPAWVLDASHLPGFEEGSLALDDHSECRGNCGQRGFCRAGTCRCAVAYAGRHCSDRIPLPGPLVPLAEGRFLLTRSRVATLLRGPEGVTAGSRKNGANVPVSTFSTAVLPFATTPSLIRALPKKDYLGSRLYDRCALVAPGDRLRGRGLQEEIDSHDLVMRFDAAGTKGNEVDVGQRTSHRVVSGDHPAWHESAEVVFQRAETAMHAEVYSEFVASNHGAPFFLLDPTSISPLGQLLRTNISSPTVGAWMALHICSEVDLYGFPLATPQAGPGLGHKTSPVGEREPYQGIHAGTFSVSEARWLSDLVRAGLLRAVGPTVAVNSHLLLLDSTE